MSAPTRPRSAHQPKNIKGERQELDRDQQHERYLKAGQFSVETPGHVWMPPFMQAVLEQSWTCDRVRSCIRPVLRLEYDRWPVWSYADLVQNQLYELVAH
jgi:hypothetical protein